MAKTKASIDYSEYLQSKKGEDEIWLKDDIFDFECIS